MTEYFDEIKRHYTSAWANACVERRWDKGPIHELPGDFAILEFAPTKQRSMWTYATCCMSQPSDDVPLELHLFSPVPTGAHVELLTAVCHYHRTGHRLGLGHTVYFGRPWLEGSQCEFGLLSLPYLDGPALEEHHNQVSGKLVRCLWVVPITRVERKFKKSHGLEALERMFQEAGFNYLDPQRKSVVQAEPKESCGQI